MLLTGLSRFHGINVVKIMFLHWIFNKACSADCFSIPVSVWSPNEKLIQQLLLCRRRETDGSVKKRGNNAPEDGKLVPVSSEVRM